MNGSKNITDTDRGEENIRSPRTDWLVGWLAGFEGESNETRGDWEKRPMESEECLLIVPHLLN